MKMRVDIVGPSVEQSLTWGEDTVELLFGRSTDRNEVVGYLPDPRKLISRKHFMLSRVGEGVLLTVVSRASGVSTTHGDVGCGQTAMLGIGDCVHLAEYTITIHGESEAPAASVPSAPLSEWGTPLPPVSRADDPFEAFWGVHSSTNMQAQPPAEPAHVPGADKNALFQPVVNLAVPMSSAASPDASAPVASPVPIIDNASWKIEQLNLPGPEVMGGPVADWAGIPMPSDWDDWLPPAVAPEQAIAPVKLDAAGPAVPDPALKVSESAEPVKPAAIVHQRLNPGVETVDAASAILRGLGVDATASLLADEAALERLGRGVRHLIEGFNVLLAARAALKRDLRAKGRTVLAEHNNNPLKNLMSIQQIIDRLVATPEAQSAYMPLDLAVKEAVNDLQVHDLALVAASRSAIEGILREFHPARLRPVIVEGKSKLPQFLDNARLWDAYVMHYEKREKSMVDWVEQSFDRYFMPTYEQVADQSSSAVPPRQ